MPPQAFAAAAEQQRLDALRAQQELEDTISSMSSELISAHTESGMSVRIVLP